jgi:hypothetical protein
MAQQQEQYPSPAQLSELSALADGSLDPTRRQAVEDWIAGSPDLRTLYERERAAVDVLCQVSAERAPARLRARIEVQRAGGSQVQRAGGFARPWAKPAYTGLAAALACAIAALALLLPGGTPGSPSVSQAAQLALRGPSRPAPVADASDPRMKLAERLQGLYFPNWSQTLGWRPVGARGDRLGGRPAVTVYYQRQGMSVAYTIVGAPALAEPSAPVTHRGRFALRALSLRGRTVVTWRRAGHTCVLSASGVPSGVLAQLADWPVARLSD